LPFSFRDSIKSLVLGCAQQRRHGQSVLRQFIREPIGAESIDEFERTPLPVVAEAHRLIDRGDVVCGLGHESGRIGQGLRDDAPCIAADLGVRGQ
jgi:hypothetical protein